MVFYNFSPKIQEEGIFVPNLGNFIEHLELDKHQGAEFKYNNSFLKSWPKIYPSKTFLVPNQAFLFFHKILKLDKFEGADFKYDISFLKLQPKNTQIRHFLSKIYTFLFFRKILKFNKFDVADFKYHNSFSKLQPKNNIRHFWSQFQRTFFREIVQFDKFEGVGSNMTIVF